MTLPLEVAKRRIDSLASFLTLGVQESEDDSEVRIQALTWVLARELHACSKERQERFNAFCCVMRMLASSLGLRWNMVAPDDADDDDHPAVH